MIRAVLDANVLVSGLAGVNRPVSLPGEIVRRWFGREFDLVVSRPIADEVGVALAKPWFRERVSVIERRRFFTRLDADARWVRDLPAVSGVAAHWHDDLVIATAVGGAADVLVTGDGELLAVGWYRGVRRITPRVFLQRFEAES